PRAYYGPPSSSTADPQRHSSHGSIHGRVANRRKRLRAQGRLGWFRLAASLLCSIAIAGVAGSAAAQQPIRVLVAALPFQVHSARALAPLETSIADELTQPLEASGKVQVVDAVVVREALIAHVSGERTDEVLRTLAHQVGAEWVVQGSVTELAGS